MIVVTDKPVRLAFWLTLMAIGLGPSPAASQASETAIFAGGCFWCVEKDFDHVEGVVSTVSGYIGGDVENPTYKQVTAGGTGHYEAVKITYDPARVSYDTLLKAFWHSVDPTDSGGQFCDRGDSYRTAIFALDPAQYTLARETKSGAAAELAKEIATEIFTASPFYPAEDYHQDYYQNNPIRYRYYRYRCGRDARVNQLWGEDAYLVIRDHSG